MTPVTDYCYHNCVFNKKDHQTTRMCLRDCSWM